jgi:hypothetical protein
VCLAWGADFTSTVPPRVRRYRSFSARPDPVSARRASGLGFVAQPSNLIVLWWTTANHACRLWSWAATLHRLLSTTLSCFSCHHAAGTWSCWPPGPSSRAYLSLHSSEAPQGIDLSHSLFTCTNANQAATCTCNTRPRISPHHVVNHSSQAGATIHRSSNALVLSRYPPPTYSCPPTRFSCNLPEERIRPRWPRSGKQGRRGRALPVLEFMWAWTNN